MDLEKFTARLTCTGTGFFSLLTMFSKVSADILEHTACCKIMVEKVGVKYESSKREIGGELQH